MIKTGYFWLNESAYPVFTRHFHFPCTALLQKESFTTSTEARIALSADTLHFDTVFTSTGSITQKFKISNTNNQKLKLDRIKLMGGQPRHSRSTLMEHLRTKHLILKLQPTTACTFSFPLPSIPTLFRCLSLCKTASSSVLIQTRNIYN